MSNSFWQALLSRFHHSTQSAMPKPETYTIEFIDADLSQAVAAYQDWCLNVIKTKTASAPCRGSFAKACSCLRPLKTPYTKVLFAETDSNWTDIIFNSRFGQGCVEHIGRLSSILNKQGIHASHIIGSKDHYDSTSLIVYGLEGKRSIQATLDVKKWIFQEHGTPMPFENLEYYKRRIIRDRMNAEILNEYLSHVDIRFFDPNFYMPKLDSKAVIVSLGKFFGVPYIPPDEIVIHTDKGDMIYQKVKQ